jgi:tetratricopeptide (TPR) repeat protein
MPLGSLRKKRKRGHFWEIFFGGKGEYDRAIEDYTKAIELDPNWMCPLNDRAVIYQKRHQWDLALQGYSRVIELAPDYAIGYTNRGWSTPPRATMTAQWPITIGRSCSIRKMRLPTTIALPRTKAKKDYVHAIADYGQVIAFDPKNAAAFNGRCYDNAVIGQLQGALADCNQSLTRRPNDVDTLDSRGFTYLKLGPFDNAIADYNAALNINAKLASSLHGRGLAEIKKGNSTAGDSDIAAAKAIQTDIAEEMGVLGVSP